VKNKQPYLPVLSFFCVALLNFSCSEGTTSINQSPTDSAKIKKVNQFITESDIKGGVRKTNNFMPTVSMSHKMHEEHGITCFTCHHKKGNDAREKRCAVCHKGKKGEDTMHNVCMNCHLAVKKGPIMCQDCHKDGPESK
jgi:hypothetical protein